MVCKGAYDWQMLVPSCTVHAPLLLGQDNRTPVAEITLSSILCHTPSHRPAHEILGQKP